MLALSGSDQQDWHARAHAKTIERFGREVFVRGVVEVSNFCRENCHYCGMRRDNRALSRYRANLDELTELLVEHRPSSITDVNIQSGEDPVAVREIVIPLVHRLRSQTNLGISVCAGTLTPALYNELQNAGARLYIMKFETADPSLYEQLEAPGTFSERVSHIRQLAANNWWVSSGFIAGLPGQSMENLLDNLRVARELPLHGCSVSPFIPGEETPLAQDPMASVDTVLNCTAALRLQQPELVIPAVSALNIACPGEGYRRGLRAGANLCTINLTPSEVRDNYLLYKRDRFIMNEERILAAIQEEGRQVSSRSLVEFYSSNQQRTDRPFDGHQAIPGGDGSHAFGTPRLV